MINVFIYSIWNYFVCLPSGVRVHVCMCFNSNNNNNSSNSSSSNRTDTASQPTNPISKCNKSSPFPQRDTHSHLVSNTITPACCSIASAENHIEAPPAVAVAVVVEVAVIIIIIVVEVVVVNNDSNSSSRNSDKTE